METGTHKKKKLHFNRDNLILNQIFMWILSLVGIVAMLFATRIIPTENKYSMAIAFVCFTLILFVKIYNELRSKYSVIYNKNRMIVRIGTKMSEVPFKYNELESYERTNSKIILHRKTAKPYERNIVEVDQNSINKLVDILETNGIESN